jgi:hypothetical protein
MPIAIFSADGTKRLGKVFEDVLIDLTVAAPDLSGTVMEFLIEEEVALDLYRTVTRDGRDVTRFGMSDCTHPSPIRRRSSLSV